MLRRSTLIVLIVFLVLVGVAVYLQYFHEEAPVIPTEEVSVLDATIPVPEDLFDFDPNAVTGLRIDAADGRVVEIEKNEDDAFVLVEPETSAEMTDALRIFDAIDTLARVEIDFDLDPQMALSAFGLDEAAYEVTLSLEDGEDVSFKIGDQVPTKTGYYVQLVDGAPKVVGLYAIDNLLTFFDNPPAIPTPTPEPTSEVTPEPQDVE